MNGPATEPGNLRVLFEDNHLIAVDKRVGDIVQGDKTGDTPLPEVIKEYLREKYEKPGAVFLGVIHRLDRPTTGIVVFARTSKALSRMNRLFASRETHKTYWALVANPPPEATGRLEHWLVRNRKQNKSYAREQATPEAKKAVLNYRILRSLDRYYLLEIDLETGRHHQIRAQLAAIGCPIKGDLKYGFPRSNPDGGIHLHARRLEFIHPVRKELVTIVCDPTGDPLWDACKGA
ncbi:RluA family pseudouridine synthase [Robiginitalea sp. SC105]|uniref:RluA family pseudouridine synthase n=1 Tax=Robiginitalea sp. SC105 TaxID=2762332 RepID=UPI0016396852|nr:RNA pseudouridine synthase [Robiginitalea sp. SC105]MBC2840721.1 RNA pseudouridine synthase [Robiginitalea sp. SC105]